MTTNPTEAQMKLARKCAAHGYPEDTYYHKNCMAGSYDELGHIQSIVLAIQATEARAQGLVDALEDSKRAVQAFLDMVNVMQRVQALPIPVFLETAQHNCPIILQNLDQELATWRRT